jgi:FemAB family protein
MFNPYVANLDVFQNEGFHVELRRVDDPDWPDISAAFCFLPTAYLKESLRYNKEYSFTGNKRAEEYSLFFYQGNTFAGFWPLSVHNIGTSEVLSSLGGDVLAPLFTRNVSNASKKKLSKLCLNYANLLCKSYNISNWFSFEQFSPEYSAGLSPWHIQCLLDGGRPDLRYALYVDLNLEMSKYKKNLRKSYRSLINSNLDLWQIEVFQSSSERIDIIWEDFIRLHFDAAGKVTRSRETWDRLKCNILEGKAFLIGLLNNSQELVGAGYFICSPNEIVYSVGAYRRSLFKKPLGHIVQWTLLKRMFNSDLSWYRLGVLDYLASAVQPTAKQISISKFKQGFATHTFPEYRIEHKVL